MSQPLASSLGNALEIVEALRVLKGEARGPLLDVSAMLGGVLLAQAGLASDVEEGVGQIDQAVRSGAAAEHFGRMIAAQGGPVQFLENAVRFLPEANVIREIRALGAGTVAAIDGEALGRTVVALGGGRAVETDMINPAVGLSEVVRIGQDVARGDVLAVVHAVRPADADRAERAVRDALTFGDATSAGPPPLIHEKVG